MLLEPDFVVSDEDGVLLEPAPAVPLGLELDGLEDDDDDEPPLALSFLFRSIEVEDELEPDGDVLGAAVVPLADEDDEPEGALLGDVVAPEGEVADELEERSAPRSHAVISVAPSAIETATARVDILMGPPWLGYWKAGANIGPRVLNHHRINRQRRVSCWSSVAHHSSGDLFRPRSTENRAAGWHASGRSAPAWGWSLRASRWSTACPYSTMSWKILPRPVGQATRCRFSATAS